MLLDIFWTLDRTRQRLATSFSLEFQPLLPSEIALWSDRAGQELTEWEFETLMAMDRARMAGPQEADGMAQRKGSKMTAEVFDAVFG